MRIWVHGDEVKEDDKSLAYLKNSTEGVSVRVCRDKKVAGFTIKPYALIHSGFDEVLLMDPDNIAILDPTVLFKTSVYKKTGAIFWPDYWRPRNTPLFHVHEESLFWSLLELSFVDMFEQESAELVVNRRVHSDALRVLLFFITEPQQFMSEWKFVHGDKDMFRLAWMKARSPFHMIQRPPGSVGDKPNEPHVFCGTTIAQYHPNEKDVMFLHRNMLKYSENGNSPGWQLIQQYKQGLDPKKYLDVEFTGGLGKRPLCAGVHKKERIGDRYTIQSVNTTWITTEKQYIQNMLHFEKGLQNLNKKN
ncbi:hypothetical protein HDU79_000918 [Rhizoclosmatium sp. JEL0117]|nr:hypothetical protein HDU79_000918 [Rhizoclosmatium sp. JEL0117]